MPRLPTSFFSRSLLALFVSLGVACGGGTAGGSERDGVGEVEHDLRASKDLRAAISGFTFWVKPGLEPRETENGSRVWVLRGRASKSLASVRSDIAGFEREGTRVSARKFEVAIAAGPELEALSIGRRGILTFETTDGESVHASVIASPRFTDLSGSSSVAVSESIRAIYDFGLVYRGQAQTREDVQFKVGPDEAQIRVEKRDESRWNVNLSATAFRKTAGAPDPVYFEVQYPNAPTDTKVGFVQLQVDEVELTRDDPATAWPEPECDESVAQCLDALTDQDAEACGSYLDVLACQ